MTSTCLFRRALRRLVRYALIVTVAGIVLSVAAAASLRAIDPPTTVVMLLEPGPVADIDYRWVDRSRISAAAARAVIAAEDQRFLEHHGIDLDQMSTALRDYRRGEPLRGASTITQQVAKNVFLWNGRSLVRKALEAWFALLIELTVPKQRILEVYLNIAEFGRGVFGVEAAARSMFGLASADLSVQDAATLAAVLPSPKRMRADAPSAYVQTRAAEIAGQMRLLDERGHYVGLDW